MSHMNPYFVPGYRVLATGTERHWGLMAFKSYKLALRFAQTVTRHPGSEAWVWYSDRQIES